MVAVRLKWLDIGFFGKTLDPLVLFDKAFDANPASTVVPFFKLPFYQFERLS